MAVWRIVKNRQIQFSHIQLQESCCSHSTYVFPIFVREGYRTCEQSCKALSIWPKTRSLSHGHLEASITLTRQKKGHELKSMLLTTERQRPLHTFRRFWIVRSANPMSPFSISVIKDFTCSSVTHYTPRIMSYANINCQN